MTEEQYELFRRERRDLRMPCFHELSARDMTIVHRSGKERLIVKRSAAILAGVAIDDSEDPWDKDQFV